MNRKFIRGGGISVDLSQKGGSHAEKVEDHCYTWLSIGLLDQGSLTMQKNKTWADPEFVIGRGGGLTTNGGFLRQLYRDRTGRLI